jgi:hypothetical protein
MIFVMDMMQKFLIYGVLIATILLAIFFLKKRWNNNHQKIFFFREFGFGSKPDIRLIFAYCSRICSYEHDSGGTLQASVLGPGWGINNDTVLRSKAYSVVIYKVGLCKQAFLVGDKLNSRKKNCFFRHFRYITKNLFIN